MKISHDLLLSLGFEESINQKNRYSYKGAFGWLNGEIGALNLQGFSQPINTLLALKYAMMMVDYQFEASVIGYPINDN